MKLLASITVALATALTSTAALADQRPAMPQAPQAPVVIADRRGADVDVLDAQRAFGRAGTLTLSAPRGTRNADLAILSSDPRLVLRRVMITYASGRTAMLRFAGGSAIDLPDQGRIASIQVSYLNRGAGRGAIVRLIARDDHRRGDGRRDDDRMRGDDRRDDDHRRDDDRMRGDDRGRGDDRRDDDRMGGDDRGRGDGRRH